MINSILASSKLVTKKVEKMANSILVKPSFKKRFTFEKRQDEALRIMKKYPDRIPIIVERSSSDTITELINKNKYLAPSSLTVGQFVYVIRKRLVLPPEKAIFLFINNVLPPTASLLGTIYDELKDKDMGKFSDYTEKYMIEANIVVLMESEFGK